MPHGYQGKILRVDLSRKNISVEQPQENFYRGYLGGRGLISYYLLRELKPGVDPLSSENKLIFAPGVSIDQEKFSQAKEVFYSMLGWDKEMGRPALTKLRELGIEWVADALPPAGRERAQP